MRVKSVRNACEKRAKIAKIVCSPKLSIMLSALLNTGASENTNIVGVTSSQIALKVLEIEKGVGDTLTKLKRERLALVDQLKLSQVEDERAQLTSKIYALEEEGDKTYNSALENAKYDLLSLTKGN